MITTPNKNAEMEQKVLSTNRVARVLPIQENRLSDRLLDLDDEMDQPEASTSSVPDAVKRRELEEEVQRLRITLEVNQKNTTNLIKQNQEILKKQVSTLKESEKAAKEELERYRHALRERNNQLSELEIEVENIRATAPTAGEAPAAGTPPVKVSRRAEKQIAHLEQVIETQKAEIAALGVAGRDQDERHENLHQEIKELNKTIEAQQQMITEKEKEVDTLTQNLIEETQQRQQLETNLFTDQQNEQAQQLISNVIQDQWEAIQEELNTHAESIPPAIRKLIDLTAFRNQLTSAAPPPAAPCNLNQLLSQLEQSYTAKAESKKIYFALSSSPLPTPLYTAPDKIEIILNSLFDYALQHTQKGRMGVHISSSPETDHLNIATQIAYTASDPHDPNLALTFDLPPTEEEENNETSEASEPETTATAEAPEAETTADTAEAPHEDHTLALLRLYARHLGGDITVDFRPNGLTSLIFTFQAQAEAAA